MTTFEFMSHYTVLQDLLFAFAMKLTKNREDAKDLCQETLMRAFAGKGRFIMGTNFKAWITTIMRNNFINEYRRLRTRNQVEQAIEENPDLTIKKAVRNEAGSVLMMNELRQMLDSMKDGHRIPFEMFLKGYEYKEIADTLNLPMGTVKSRIFFARQKMKEMIHQRYGTLNIRHA